MPFKSIRLLRHLPAYGSTNKYTVKNCNASGITAKRPIEFVYFFSVMGTMLMDRDLRQLLWPRMVQARTRVMNQLQAVALNEGLRFNKRLWRAGGRQQLESFQLAPWASGRRASCWSCWID